MTTRRRDFGPPPKQAVPNVSQEAKSANISTPIIGAEMRADSVSLLGGVGGEVDPALIPELDSDPARLPTPALEEKWRLGDKPPTFLPSAIVFTRMGVRPVVSSGFPLSGSA